MKDLTKGNIYKTFFLFGLPLVLSGLLSQLYNTIDTAIAGKFLGDKGLASVGSTSPLISFISSAFWGYIIGFGVYVGRLFGKGDYEKIKSSIYSTFLFLMVFCAVISTLLILFYKPIFAILHISPNLYESAFGYFGFYIAGLFFIILNLFFAFTFNAFGIGTFTFYASLLSTVLNIGGNVLAVTVLELGTKGLAIASVFSAIAVDCFYIVKLRQCFKRMGVHKIKPQLSFRYIKNAFPFAIPNMAQQSVMSVTALLLSPLVNSLGTSASASYSVVLQIYNICAQVYQNSARSLSNYSAQCVGQNKCENIKKGVLVGLLQGLAFVAPFIIACSVFHKPICSLFFDDNADQATKEYAFLFASTYLPFICLNLVCNLFHGLFRAVKATGYLFGSTFFATVVRYIASLILMKAYGMEGFFLGWAISWLLEAVFVTLLFFFGKWLPKNATE